MPPAVEPLDLKQPDRISRTQLQSLHLVHENFVRNLASSLSAYLRSYVTLNLVSLEQISYAEFVEGFTLPTCLAYLGLQPYDGTAILELSNGLMFGLLELLLGSKGRSSRVIDRKITDIEKTLVQTLLQVVLRDLRDAWKSVTEIAFSVQSLASEPQLVHVLAPSEAVIVIAVEVRAGSTSGLMNLAVPSMVIKRLRHRFEQMRQVKKAVSSGDERLCMERLIKKAKLAFEVRLPAGTISGKTLLDLQAGDVLELDVPVGAAVSGFLNGKETWAGRLGSFGNKLAFELVHEKKTAAAS